MSGIGARSIGQLPGGIDHLVYAVADLERGRDTIEKLLGVRPVLGGRHPHYGTHNALLSLGATTYLEVIAPDPGLEIPQAGVLFGADRAGSGRLVTWVLRAEEIGEASQAAKAAGIEIGAIESGSRTKPDGSTISWQLSDPYAMPMQGAVPFLISWGATLHPALTAPRAGTLIELEIQHPEPGRVRQALAALGTHMKVTLGSEAQLVAQIKTARGLVELR